MKCDCSLCSYWYHRFFHLSLITYKDSMFFNFHTHHIDPEVACMLNADFQTTLPHHTPLSVGIHPWNVDDSWEEKMAQLRPVVSNSHVWAIGECGLDKVRGRALPLQIEAFKAQTVLAEELQKPVVIHCVKAFDVLLNLRKEQTKRAATQPWVIHGFRGNPILAKQLISAGILLSLSPQCPIDTLREIFSLHCSFFLETDDLPCSVRQIYEQVCHHLGVDDSHLYDLCDPLQTIFRHHAKDGGLL